MNNLASLGILVVVCSILSGVPATAQVFTSIEEIDLPVTGDAEGPSVAKLPDGRIALTWTELDGPVRAAIRFSIRDNDSWSDAVTVAEGDDLFVNYADFPSAAVLADGTLAVHWMQMSSGSSYGYNTNIALSHDDGATWGEAIVPHRDATAQQHGFVSMVADGTGGIMTMWLDGRTYNTASAQGAAETDGDEMQLRATTVASDGTLSDDILIDDRTCTCCQTTAVALDDGSILLAYRDRSEKEIRDISLVRWNDGIWSDPIGVSEDGWEISGCPVNGPAIDATGDRAALVWFTGADDTPAVRMAFSADRGTTFGAPIRVDLGAPFGGVDVVQLADGTALVSWVENTAAGEALLICRAAPKDGCGDPVALTVARSGRTVGFPRMVASGADIWIVWNEPSHDVSGRPDGTMTIRAARATVALMR